MKKINTNIYCNKLSKTAHVNEQRVIWTIHRKNVYRYVWSLYFCTVIDDVLHKKYITRTRTRYT